MRRIQILTGIIIALSACQNADTRLVLSAEKIREIGDLALTVEPFWNVFGSLKGKYSITDAESKVLGLWSLSLGSEDIGGYIFYPNRLFLWRGHVKFKNRPNSFLELLAGEWSVEKGKIIANISVCVTGTWESSAFLTQSIKVHPYKMEIVALNSIEQLGYSNEPFQVVRIPNELTSNVELPENVLPANLIRQVGYRLIFPLSKPQFEGAPLDIDYGVLALAPEMAKRDWTSENILKDDKIFEEFLKLFNHYSGGQ